MAQFKKVKRFENIEFNLPSRKTVRSAGYDMEVAEDITIPAYQVQLSQLIKAVNTLPPNTTLKDMARMTKTKGIRPTLVSTGVKCYLDEDEYLELSLRSSTPLKYWLIMANSIGVIDGDYADNVDNEGEIFIPIINLGPKAIHLKKGDIIAQGIIHKFGITEDDKAEGERVGGFGSTNGQEDK